MLRVLNAMAPIFTTPIAQLSGEKILETMEDSKSLEEELLAEEICPECGHVPVHDPHLFHENDHFPAQHDHEHHHHDHDHGEHEHDHEHEHHHDHDHGEHEHHHHDHDHGDHEHDHDHEHHHHHDHECGCGHDHDHGHHHADEVFTSWGRETIRTYTKEEISEILSTLESDSQYGTVLRAKGMVAGSDGEWIYFDMVPEEHEVRNGAAEYTGRICVIGAGLNEEKLEVLFGLTK